jgi:uncharacterized protein
MDAATARPRRWLRTRRVVLVPASLYVGVVAVFATFQARLIFPGGATQGRPEAVVQPAAGTELVTLTTADGDRVVALFGPALTADGRPHPDAALRPTILDFYGNGMCLKAAAALMDSFRRLGANVLIPEYVGYGMSSGRPSEAGCYATADAAYAHLLARKDVDPTKIVALGWSLGGAVAIDLAARRPVAGLVVLSSFTSMAEVARAHYPFLPASLLLRHRFDSLAKIRRVSCPTLIGHGREDRLIPFVMADRLAIAAGGPVARLAVEDAGHNDFFLLGRRAILESLGRFLDPAPPRP